MADVCYICGQEAVERCFRCGELFCPQHGAANCIRCETGIAAGGRRTDPISAAPMKDTYRPGWWRPQQAEDYEPPSCHICKGLARRTCQNCRLLYCPEHAGSAGLCCDCTRSSWLGLIVFAGCILLLAGFLLLTLWRG